jgi:hypothetical protein
MLNQERHWVWPTAMFSFSNPLIARPNRRRSEHPRRSHPEIAMVVTDVTLDASHRTRNITVENEG